MSAPVDVQFRAPVDVFDACLRGQPVLLVEAHHARAAVADAIAANVAMLAALDEAFGIKPTHDDERIYDELPSSGVARAYFMARDAVKRCKGESA
jgi:Pyruvate/2-oxoacid:ferredoxin oxidoreductase gamma subunit